MTSVDAELDDDHGLPVPVPVPTPPDTGPIEPSEPGPGALMRARPIRY